MRKYYFAGYLFSGIKKILFPGILSAISCCFFSCRQPVQPGDADAKTDAQQLVDSAVVRMNTGNEDDVKLALMLLKRASTLDSNNYFAWWDQVLIYNEQKKYDKSLEAEMQMIRLSNRHPDHLAATGILYYRLNDTTSADKYFSEALQQYNGILDTVAPGSADYDYFVMNKGIVMIMAGDAENGNALLKQIYTSTTDTLLQRSMLDFIDKTPDQILEKMDSE